MATILKRAFPELHELHALSDNEREQIPVVTPTAAMMRQLGLWIFQDDRDGRLWLGQQAADVHTEDRWLYRSAMEDEAEGSVAFWHGVGSHHRPRTENMVAGDIDPYLRLQTFNSKASSVRRELRGFTDSYDRSAAWLLSFTQLFGDLNLYLISLLPERVNWAALHQIVWHLDTFRTQHDVEDMPLDLILRMYGLGQLAATQPQLHPALGFVWKG